jgi:hypothetical protein
MAFVALASAVSVSVASASYFVTQYPSFPKRSNNVGLSVARLGPELPTVACFYPTSSDSVSGSLGPYVREGLVDRAASWTKWPKWVFSFLRNVAPYRRNAKPLQIKSKSGISQNPLPIVIFSHGLSGMSLVDIE